MVSTLDSNVGIILGYIGIIYVGFYGDSIGLFCHAHIHHVSVLGVEGLRVLGFEGFRFDGLGFQGLRVLGFRFQGLRF